MASSINASTTAGVVTTADTSGVLNIQTAGTTAITVDASQVVSIGTTNVGGTLNTTTTSGNWGEIIYDLANNASMLAFRNASGAAAGNISLSSAGATSLLISSVAGVNFPATQVASANANTLDDYEEGTWTPVDGSGASLSFTVLDARYTKIGRMVECFAQITYPSTANTSSAAISGLPFTMATTGGGAYGAFTVYATEPTAVVWLNLSNTATSNAYTLGGASATNATFSTDNFRLVWIYETA